MQVREQFRMFCTDLSHTTQRGMTYPDKNVVVFFLEVLITARLPFWHIGGVGNDCCMCSFVFVGVGVSVCVSV